MTASTLILSIVAILVYCGLVQRVLDRMYLSDRAALLLTGLMLAGSFLPPLKLGMVEIGIGGGLIPLGVCLWLMLHAGREERFRTLLGCMVSASVIYALGLLLPAEAEALPVDPTLVMGVPAGLTAWLLGRSRRGAFVCGVVGVLAADTAIAILNRARGTASLLRLGTGGLADAAVISGVLAVLLCEVVGELAERLTRRRRKEERS